MISSDNHLCLFCARCSPSWLGLPSAFLSLPSSFVQFPSEQNIKIILTTHPPLVLIHCWLLHKQLRRKRQHAALRQTRVLLGCFWLFPRNSEESCLSTLLALEKQFLFFILSKVPRHIWTGCDGKRFLTLQSETIDAALYLLHTFFWS